MAHGDSTRAAGRLHMGSWYGAAGLVALFAAGAIMECVHLASLQNPAVWGHLRAGMWILENKSFPRTGIFSQAANLPWRDFSWGYDAIVAVAYKVVGTRAVPLMAIAFRVIVTAALFLLAGARRGKLRGAAGLAAVGLCALSGLGPVSTGVSAILFGAELLLLLEFREGRDVRVMFVLPVLIVIWANLDLGFVYGIIVLVLFVISRFAAQITETGEITADERKLARNAAVALVACVTVSGITPYGFAGYAGFWQMETSAANLNIPGYGAMGFRQVLDFVVLLLAMGAFLALGLRRSRDAFLIALLCGSAASAFHSQRENWLLVVSSVTVIGAMFPGAHQIAGTTVARTPGIRQTLVAGLTVAVTGMAFLALIPRESSVLMRRVAETLPVKACDYIRSASLPQPLFNAYEWGAFLTWYLPEYPVAIDARRGLYPEELETDYFKVMRVEIPYQSLPAMKNARTILLQKSNVLGGGLRNVPGFQVAYEDDVAIVLLQGAKE